MDHAHIHWIGHATFRIEDGAAQIYIDPWKVPAGSPKADIILITHAHYDHYSPEDIEQIRTPDTILVAPKDVAEKIGTDAIAVVPGCRYTVGPVKIQTIPAYNVDKKFHPKESGWVGYVVTLTSGQKIYHSGDSDHIPEMQSVVADVALLPCGGTYTMNAIEVASAANSFKPKILIPMHWGDIVGSAKDSDAVKKLFKGETVIKQPEH
jgi:L-ascorbate metabolism protein UlaG (beta-lactamase superfamily)